MVRDREVGRSVRASCVALGASVSAYYEWCGRALSDRDVEDRRLAVEVRAIHRESRQTYGARRVHAELLARGTACGRHRIGRLMREGGLVARGPKRKPPTATSQTPLTPVAENVLDRQFAPVAPDRVWTADITYISTGEGWLYLAVVLDLFSRRVVGWAVRPSLGRELATAAFSAALQDRRPRPGLVCHSDQGTQYTSSDYRALLRRHEVVCSMSRRGNCHDNAPTESLFGSLKTECVRGERFETHDEARAALFDYLAFYNHRRRHSALGYQSPAEHERRHHEQRALRLAA
ncbi:MAG TPA: IS3 family transposase [Rubricoccaceae bacterium]|jgi:putative transposase